MRHASFTDELGRTWTTALPEGVPDRDAALGIAVGPPPLDDLGLPPDVQTRLHNQLHERGILTAADTRDRQAVLGAIMAALKVDVQRIISLYVQPSVNGVSDGKSRHALSNDRRPMFDDKGEPQKSDLEPVGSTAANKRPIAKGARRKRRKTT